MSSNPSVILNGDQIYVEELIRENAGLTVQHEVDRQIIEKLKDQIDEADKLHFATVPDCAECPEVSRFKKRLYEAKKVIEALMPHTNMGCDLCAATCNMGDECCPVWKDGRDL